MKFSELFVGDTFNFVSDELDLGTCFISYYTDILYGDIKMIYSSALNKAFPFMNGEKPILISDEIIIPFDTKVELLNRTQKETVLNAITYYGSSILYSSHEDNTFIFRTSKSNKYVLSKLENGFVNAIKIYLTFDDALYGTFDF